MNLFEAVKENVSARDVATAIGFRPTRSNMICCPFHDDKHPSMKVDRRYFCFGCGARGDAIDFAAGYYGMGPKDAAIWIAKNFDVRYDKASFYSNGENHSMVKNERSQWAETKRALFARIQNLHEFLRRQRMKYAPTNREDSEWSPLFARMVHDYSYVDYLFDYCMFEATDEELKKEYEKMTKEITEIEKRNINTKPGTGRCDVGQI